MSMTSEYTRGLRVFIAYAREDEHWCDVLEQHLQNLKRQAVITSWYAYQTVQGQNKSDPEVDRYLDTADIILLLLSPDFIASRYSYTNW